MTKNLNFWDKILTDAEKKHIANLNKWIDILFPAESVSDYQGWYTEKYGTESIKHLQKALNQSPDGIIGNKTLFSIIRYQKDNNLSPDGLLNDKIMSSLIAKYQNSSKNTQQQTLKQQQILSKEVSDLQDIRAYYKDWSKEQLRAIQKHLWVVADGIIGTKTILAIKQFQKDISTTPDGKLTPASLKTLQDDIRIEHYEAISHSNKLKALIKNINFNKVRNWYNTQNLDSSLIKNIQQQLWVYPRTGSMDDKTIIAIMERQEKIWLQPTGKMSQIEIRDLLTRSKSHIDKAEIRRLADWWKQNHSPESIQVLQMALKIPVDGIAGITTINAVKKYQISQWMEPTGMLSRYEITGVKA